MFLGKYFNHDSKIVPRFIVTEASRLDLAFGTPSRYDNQRALFGPKQPVYELEGALARYQELGCSPGLAFNPQNCSWNEVLDRLADAQAAYESKANGIKGIVHKVTRKIGDNADSITPAFDMLPDQYGLAIVKGGLGWMFLLIKEAASKRKAILAAFKEVPETIRMAEHKRKNFPNDILLNSLADELNNTVIYAVCKMIRFLLPKHLLFKVFPVRPDAPSGQEVDDILKDVKAAVDALQGRASVLVETMVVQTQKIVEKSGREVQATRQNTMLTLQATHDIHKQVAALPDGISNLQKSVDDMQAEIQDLSRREREAVNAWTSTANQTGIAAQNWMQQLLDDLSQGFQAQIRLMETNMQLREDWMLGAMQLLELEVERARTPRLDATPLLTAAQLLGILAVSPESLTHDLNIVIREGMHLDTAAQIKAQSLLKMNRFWQWFSSASSDLLMVSGDLVDYPQAARISPLSVLCASIVGSLVKTHDHALPLYFFCGHHVAAGDTMGGPQDLMRSLVARLLHATQASNGATTRLDFINNQASVKALSCHDIVELCHVFRHLVSRFPRHITIYCILNGISWYERLEMLESLFHVVQMLAGLVDDLYLRPVLKVLMTSPFLSRRIAPQIPDHRRVFLRSTLIMHDSIPDRVLMTGFMSRTPPWKAERASIGFRSEMPIEYEETAEDYSQ